MLRTPWRRAGLAVAFTAGALLLPFIVLLRSTLAFQRSLPAWLALVLGAGCAALLLTGYWGLFTSRLRPRAAVCCAVLVAAYCLYAVFALPEGRAKDARVRAGYASLHPALRLAAGTTALFDAELVVTDTARLRADYEKMGLAARERSLHYRGPDGFVRAVDIRTLGRGFCRNALTALWLRALGLRTLRHHGTEDHLHVSLPS